MPENNKKILLGILMANGDCLMATVLAKQIKKDYPGCHLTWAVSNICRQIVDNNPFVNDIWEVSLTNKKEAEYGGWYKFQEDALKKKDQGEFDEVFFTQIYPINVCNYDGTTRGTIYNSYPHPITVEATPVLRLYDHEVEKVKEYALHHHLHNYRHVILFECAPNSGQSFVTGDFALEVANKLIQQEKDIVIIISTHLSLTSPHPRIIIGNDLTLRENAEISKYCTLLVGCSSGITWICSSDWAKQLPSVQFLKRAIGFRFASVVYDHKYWKLDHSQIIETTVKNTAFAVQLIKDVLDKGVDACKPDYHKNLHPLFISMLKYCFMFFRQGKFVKSWRIARNFILRNYIRKERPY